MTQRKADTDAANPSAAYGAWVASVASDWPDAAWHEAKRATLDISACMVAGATDIATQNVLQVVSTWGTGGSAVIGSDQTLAAPWAALVNGTAAHAIDYDDVFDPAKTHGAATLMPALYALGEQEGSSGRDVLDAFIVGLQIMAVVGQGLLPHHRYRGWHTTSTVGAVACAAACARLLKLDASQSTHAINMSTSLAGGFMSQFGSMTKPLHAGLACLGGVMAASLARQGMTAGHETLVGRTGMGTLMVGLDREDLQEEVADLDEYGQKLVFRTDDIAEPLAILEYGLKYKRFPNCASVHRALDALLILRDRHGFATDQVAEVEIISPQVHLNNLMYHDPKTPSEAKFSMEYCIAVGLLSGTNTLADFTPDAIIRPEVRALFDRIKLTPVDKLESEFSTVTKVTLVDGTVDQANVSMPVGHISNPMSDDQLMDKFRQCADGKVSAATAQAAIDQIWQLDEDVSITTLTGKLT